MQTYIVMGLIALAAVYVGRMFLRKLGFFGAPLGCDCACAGACPTAQGAAKLTPLLAGKMESSAQRENSPQACCGCSSFKACGQAPENMPPASGGSC